MTSTYRKEHEASYSGYADPFADMLSAAGRSAVINASAFFEGQVDNDTTPEPSAGERLALKRAMARFLIDSGIASARGWV